MLARLLEDRFTGLLVDLAIPAKLGDLAVFVLRFTFKQVLGKRGRNWFEKVIVAREGVASASNPDGTYQIRITAKHGLGATFSRFIFHYTAELLSFFPHDERQAERLLGDSHIRLVYRFPTIPAQSVDVKAIIGMLHTYIDQNKEN